MVHKTHQSYIFYLLTQYRIFTWNHSIIKEKETIRLKASINTNAHCTHIPLTFMSSAIALMLTLQNADTLAHIPWCQLNFVISLWHLNGTRFFEISTNWNGPFSRWNTTKQKRNYQLKSTQPLSDFSKYTFRSKDLYKNFLLNEK